MKFFTLTASAVLLASSAAFAVGSDDETPPPRTETSAQCTDAQIFDEASGKCVDAKESRIDDDSRYDAVRELAYDAQYGRALGVIATADDPQDPRFLNYKGFVNRKMGNMEVAMDYYRQALAIDPDYSLARAYFGQGLLAMGDIDGAKAQLAEIRARGDRGTWAYAALKQALSGQSSSY